MIVEGSFRLLNLDKTKAVAREQSRRQQEAAKRGTSTTSDKPDNSTASAKTSEKKSSSGRAARKAEETKSGKVPKKETAMRRGWRWRLRNFLRWMRVRRKGRSASQR